MPFMVNIICINVNHKRHIGPYLVKNKPEMYFIKDMDKEDEG